jgi:hypothetical protein
MPTSRRRVSILASLVLAPLAAGCGGAAATGEPMWAWRSPELLYLLAEPCDRLYVEVDTVEGLSRPARSVARLEEVLREYCDKPAGIHIARGRPIPLDRAKGKPPRLLALQNIDGPPAGQASARTAYLYVLFYDSKRQGLDGTENPHVDRHYPHAILVDVAYWPHITRHLQREIITHELGHVLGACKNKVHGDGLHCHNADCVMSGRLDVPLHTWLLSLPPLAPRRERFCRQCRADIRAARAQRPDPRLRFRGPVLTRQEEGYCVGFLPGCVRLSFSAASHLNWEQSRAGFDPLIRQHAARLRGDSSFLYLRDAPSGLGGKHLAVAKAANDPNPVVARVAADLLRQLPPARPASAGGSAGPDRSIARAAAD